MSANVRDTANSRKTAAELYEVQLYHQRFDQKNNITRQMLWNPPVMELLRKLRENTGKFVESKRPGYSLVDWAFFAGAIANMVNNGFNVNWPNRHGNSWRPLAELGQPQNGLPRYVSHGKLEADPPTASRIISKASQQFGADQVGFARLDRRWVYSHWYDEDTKEHFPIKFSDEPGYEPYQEPVQLQDKTQVIPAGMKYVIVLIHEMDRMGMAAAPTLTQFATTMTTYSKISFTTVMLAEFIRGLGYSAIPGANDTALSIPLAIDAGLGELGRNAKLITPRFGPRCRISKVITDLPLTTGSARLWGVTEFCNVCRKCAVNCPAHAIPMGERSFEPLGDFNQRGVRVWQVNHLKCYEYCSSVGTYCGICIRTCPFNKSAHWSHNLVRSVIRRKNGRIDSLIARMDDRLGYGKFGKPEGFWS